jgi:hypothetical protein
VRLRTGYNEAGVIVSHKTEVAIALWRISPGASRIGAFPCQNVKNELNIKESLCFIWLLKEFYVSLHRE